MILLDYCRKKGIEINLPKLENIISNEYPEHSLQPIILKENWPVEEFEKFLTYTELSEAPIKLNSHTTIIDIEKFINSHLEIAKAKNGESIYRPYWERLLEFRNLFSTSK